MKNECIQVDMSSDEEIENTPPTRSQVVKSKAQHTQENKNLGGTTGMMLPPSMDALPVRSTRSKTKEMHQVVSPPAKKEFQRVTKDDTKLVGVPVTSELRCTRSKMRDLQVVSPPVVTTPPNATAGTPSTATRSKG